MLLAASPPAYEHDVLRRTHGHKHLRHPVVGELTPDYETLSVTDDPEQTLGLYTAEPGSNTDPLTAPVSAVACGC